jgi:hypothetical protein
LTLVDTLNLIEDILLEPSQLYEELKYVKGRPAWENNIETIPSPPPPPKRTFKVKTFPYVMYLARLVGDDSRTWTAGHYEPAVGHYIKCEMEFRTAGAYATIINSRADWENGAWREFDPTLVPYRPVSLPRRFRYACELWSEKIRSIMRRPGRVERFQRFCKRVLHRIRFSMLGRAHSQQQ